MSDDDHVVLTSRAAVKRQSAAQYLLALMDADLRSCSAPALNRKMYAKDQERADYQAKPFLDRPFTKHLTKHRGYSQTFLRLLDKDQVYAVYLADSWAGPDGTRDGEHQLTPDERMHDLAVYNGATGQDINKGKPQPPITAPADEYVDVDVDFEE
jgi:hypothetical protein